MAKRDWRGNPAVSPKEMVPVAKTCEIGIQTEETPASAPKNLLNGVKST